MADGNILSDFGINILEEEIDDVIFQTMGHRTKRILRVGRKRHQTY